MNFNSTFNESQRFCFEGTKQDCGWCQNIISISISVFGISANLLCSYLFTRRKSFLKSSYVYYLRLISLADSCSLFVALVQALNDFLIMSHLQFALYPKKPFSLKLIRFLADTFQLNTAWLICAFSIQRCVFINSPLVFRRFLNVTKRKRIFILILLIAMSVQVVGIFTRECYKTNGNSDQRTLSSDVLFLRVYQYFNQMTCLVLVPMMIIIPCNAVVFFRVMQRRRMIKSGNLHMNFRINRNGNKFTGIELTRCNRSTSNRLSIINNDMRLAELESTEAFSGFTTDDLGSTHEDARSDGARLSICHKLKRSKNSNRARLLRDIKIFLLMIYSISFLVFVLPDTSAKFLRFFATHEALIRNIDFHALSAIFYQLKLLYFSSNFLAYLTLATFSRKKSSFK